MNTLKGDYKRIKHVRDMQNSDIHFQIKEVFLKWRGPDGSLITEIAEGGITVSGDRLRLVDPSSCGYRVYANEHTQVFELDDIHGYIAVTCEESYSRPDCPQVNCFIYVDNQVWQILRRSEGQTMKYK